MPHQSFFRDCRPSSSLTETSHLEMYRGDTLEFKVFLTENNQPVDITGGFFWFTIKDDINDTDAQAIIVKDSNNGITITNSTLGQLVVLVEPIETISLNLIESTTYYWDLQYQDVFGVVHTVFFGKLTVKLDVTRYQGFNVVAVLIIGSGFLNVGLIVAGIEPIQDGTGLINEIQRVRVDGATGGTFTITVEDPNNIGTFETTSAISYNASDATIESTLETDISFIDDVTVTGGPNLDISPVDVEFTGALVANLDFSLCTMDTSLLS